jgi:hypothetical protein
VVKSTSHILLPQIPSLSHQPPSPLIPAIPPSPRNLSTVRRLVPHSWFSALQKPRSSNSPEGRTAPIGRPPPAAKGMCIRSAPPSAPKGYYLVMSHPFSCCISISLPLSTS